MIFKKQIALAFLFGLLAFTSCETNSGDEESAVDHTSNVIGTYNSIYSSDSFVSLSTEVVVTKVNNEKVLITPSAESEHPSFEAMVSLTTTSNYGLSIATQTNGDYSVEGVALENSDFDGGCIVADKSLIYTLILKNDLLTDTVTVYGIKN